MMQCPVGHPRGPQVFCPICGQRAAPVTEERTEAPDRGTAAAKATELIAELRSRPVAVGEALIPAQGGEQQPLGVPPTFPPVLAPPVAAQPAEPDSHQEHRSRPPRRALALVGLVAVVLLLGYLVATQLLGGTTTPAPTQRTAGPARVSPLAAALLDPHFKHGYQAGVARARLGPVSPAGRDAVCRSIGLTQRRTGYPFGQHDLVGCIAGLSG